jgi:WD40 repeat protein
MIWSFDLTSGQETVFELEEGVNSARHLALSQDGKMLAQGYSNQVNLWTVHTLQTSRKHRRGVEPWERIACGGVLCDLTFSPDGSTLAMLTLDGQAELWSVDDQTQTPNMPPRTIPKQILQIGPPAGKPWEVHYTPEGRHLITVNGNGTVYVLRLSELTPDAVP